MHLAHSGRWLLPAARMLRIQPFFRDSWTPSTHRTTHLIQLSTQKLLRREIKSGTWQVKGGPARDDSADPIFRPQVKAAGWTFSTPCSFDLRATWSTPLSRLHLRRVVGTSRSTTIIPGERPFCHYPTALIVAQPSARAPPCACRVQPQAPVHRIPHPPSPGGTSSPPRARAYP